MAVNISGAPTSETIGKIGDHLVDSTTGKVYECISVNTYGGHDAVTFKQKKKEYVWKCIGDDPNYGRHSPSGGTPYQQLVTDGDGVVKWEDRLAYEVSVTSDIAGLEYTIDGFDSGTYTAEHSDIPLELGQVWSVTKITESGNSYAPENVEVQKDEDGTLYIGSPPSSNVGEGNLPYSVTKNKTILSWYWYTRSYIRKIKLVGVSGTHTTTTLKQIDPKYVPKEVYFVKFDGRSLDKTFDEITEAYNAGMLVVLDGSRMHGLMSDIDSERLEFVCIDANASTTIILTSDNTISQIINVSFTMDDNGTFTNRLILPSSTSGSSKRFDITVDDTGTISATEVT